MADWKKENISGATDEDDSMVSDNNVEPKMFSSCERKQPVVRIHRVDSLISKHLIHNAILTSRRQPVVKIHRIYVHIVQKAKVESSKQNFNVFQHCYDTTPKLTNGKIETDKLSSKNDENFINEVKSEIFRNSKIKTEGRQHSFTCNICGVCLATKYGLEVHIRFHTGEKPYKCQFCQREFTTSFKLSCHVKVRHLNKGKLLKCNKCDKLFSLSKLNEHLRVHNGERSFVCNICEKSFVWKSAMARHLKTHSEEKPFKCTKCSKHFKSESHLRSHVKVVHLNIKPFSCTKCDKRFSSVQDLQRHEIIHTGERPHKCNTCEKTFKTRKQLTRHIKTHSGIKPHACNYCNWRFLTRQSLRRHINAVHCKEKPYKCTTCAISFTELAHLKKHELVHSGIKPYKCEICNISFTLKCNLKTHQAIHIHGKENSKFECSFCGKRFVKKSGRNRHISAVHCKEKAHKCGFCGRRFSSKAEINTHIRSHTKEKPYKCNLCEKSFRFSSSLIRYHRHHDSHKQIC